ncbi:GumC family protein [Ferruginivarius sediminum]|uniref:non-specific protein-tyrosine kinase n=1 Tax=Ferruginivarius sediminum TaxID=2661937 RepID=A0A369TJU4_9PROT|nr:polysaccharide biosynthesis tyrosine autokinase [Ferruginivarius sediminum]RDD63176.1 hypothetical protein DRB17_05270 [Ferruginivarius sediminum]
MTIQSSVRSLKQAGDGDTGIPAPHHGAGRIAPGAYHGHYGHGPDRNGPPDPASAGIDLRFLFGVLRRHKVLIIGLVSLITVCAALYVSQLTPLYRADAQIVLDPDRRNIVPVQKVVGDLSVDWQTAETEAAVIASHELAREAVLRLQLADSELFNPEPKAGEAESRGMVALFKDLLRQGTANLRVWLQDVGVLAAPPPPRRAGDGTAAQTVREPWEQVPATESNTDPLIERLTSQYLAGLSVFASERSRVITVRYISTDPRFAAVAANTTAALYIESQAETKTEVTNKAGDWLRGRVEEVQARLLESRSRLHEFRQQSGLGNGSGPSLPAQQLAQLNSQLVNARGNMAEVRARYEQVQQLLKNPGEIETAAAVLDSDLIEQLRVQEIRLNRRVAELETQFRDSHPKMINARAELANLQDRIENEVGKIASNLGNEYQVAQVRVRNLETEIARLQSRIDELNDAEVKLQTLQSEVDANEELYRTLLQRLKETSVQEDTIQQPDARIINQAQPPGGPFYPNKKIFVAMAFIVSAGLAVCLAFLLEYLDAGFRSLTQMENQTGHPSLGLVPAVKLRRNQQPHSTLALRQGSIFAESIRTLRTSLMLAPGGKRPSVVMVTSSVPHEGKTSTTLSLAAQMVQTGQRCIVVDCDLRVANLGGYLGFADRLGLSDFLAGNARLDEVIEVDPASGVHFITAGSEVYHPDELLGSDVMVNLVRALAQEYETVILDTPPVLAVSDALLLAGKADAVVYLVHWGKTKRELVQRGLQHLAAVGAPYIGLVLSHVDLRKHAQYDYTDSGQYYGDAYRKYYGAR